MSERKTMLHSLVPDRFLLRGFDFLRHVFDLGCVSGRRDQGVANTVSRASDLPRCFRVAGRPEPVEKSSGETDWGDQTGAKAGACGARMRACEWRIKSRGTTQKRAVGQFESVSGFCFSRSRITISCVIVTNPSVQLS